MEDTANLYPPGYRYARRDMLATVRKLSVIDDRRNALLLFLQWAIAIAAGAVAIHLDSVPVYIVAGFVIGSRIQCLAVMMHDACHSMLFSNRRMARDSRIWAPFANFHSPGRFGYHFPLALRIRYVVWAVLFYGMILISPWRWQILGLLLIPQFIWANVFNRIRAIAEHNGVANERELNGTRTIIPTLLDRFLIAPLNVSYHLEHHLFPSVPWQNLRRLHGVLMTDPSFATHAHITRSYWGVMRELMPPSARDKGEPVAASVNHQV